jgi:hypothetical protein
MMIYKVCTINKLRYMKNNSQLNKILNFQKYYLLSKSLKAEQLSRLRSLPQIHQDTNLDRECSQVIYKP